MKHIGIDYGSKRVGLAISDEGGDFAFPYSIEENNLHLEDKILEIIEKENIEAIVLGESMDSSGVANKIMGSIEEFKRNIEARTDIPVYFQKEFMTTLEARGREGKEVNNARKVAGSKNKNTQTTNSKTSSDSSAAALILQRYLDKRNQK